MPIYDVKSSPLKTHSNIFSYCVSKLGLTVNDSTTTEEISLQLAKTEPDLSANAKDTFLRRYCETDNTGNPIETPGDVFRRVGRMLSDVEKKYGATTHQCIEWHILMSSVITSKLFMPAGRTLANEDKKVVPNCIVLEIEDSIDSIAEVLKNSIILQKHGSGLGFPLHKMRPAGDWAAGSRSHASGPVSFLHMYNGAFGVIKQQGRNGANMAVMSVDHPDILEFVHCKEREGDIVNFNISVGLVDDFMVRVATGDKEPYMARFKGIKRAPHRVKRNQRRHYQGHTDVVMTAEEMFKEIIATAHTNGEPGCVFLDTVNATNPLPRFGKLESCNPCGEQFLHNGDVW
jgi:ribonucleoside-diphosphate reductase alpha chain